jgi:hypothetical protein
MTRAESDFRFRCHRTPHFLMRTANLPLYVDHMFAGMAGGMFMASHSYNEKNICSRCGVSERAATYFGWDVCDPAADIPLITSPHTPPEPPTPDDPDDFCCPRCHRQFTPSTFPFAYEYVGVEMPRKLAKPHQHCPNCNHTFTYTHTCPTCKLGILNGMGVTVPHTIAPSRATEYYHHACIPPALVPTKRKSWWW